MKAVVFNSQSTGQEDVQLAVFYLNRVGISCNTMASKYHVSKHSLGKIKCGMRISEPLHEQFYRLLMTDLDQVYQRTHSLEILAVMTEVGRLHAGLLRSKEILSEISGAK